MTVENAIKKLEKLGKVENDKNRYWVKLNESYLNFIKNGGDLGNAICFHIDHYQNNKKYHTTYFDNVTQMIKFATRQAETA